MSAARRLERLPADSGFVPILLANALPLVGVLWLGWDASVVVTIYAVEAILSFPLAAVEALFAQRPPRTDHDDVQGVATASDELTRRRGSVELVSWLPPIYPRNIPFVATVVTAVGWFVLAISGVLSQSYPVGDVLGRPEVAVSVGALVAGRAIDSWRDYFRGGRHESVSAYTVVETPIRQTCFLVLVLAVVPRVGGVVVLGAVVFAKLFVEWSAFRATHGDGGRFAAWLAGPDEPPAPADPPEVPDADPDARISTDGTAVLYAAAFRTLLRAPFSLPWFLVLGIGALAILGGGDPARSVLIGLAFVVLFLLHLALEFGTFALTYWSLEYRRYDDRLVAYDAWVEEPQWAVPLHEIREATVVSTRLADRLLGTRTIDVTTGWGDDEQERQLGPVSDGDAFVSAFELPMRSTDLEPINRRIAAIAVGLGVGTVGGVLALVVGPWGSASDLLFGGIFVLFALFISWQIWFQAYPDAE